MLKVQVHIIIIELYEQKIKINIIDLRLLFSTLMILYKLVNKKIDRNYEEKDSKRSNMLEL